MAVTIQGCTQLTKCYFGDCGIRTEFALLPIRCNFPLFISFSMFPTVAVNHSHRPYRVPGGRFKSQPCESTPVLSRPMRQQRRRLSARRRRAAGNLYIYQLHAIGIFRSAIFCKVRCMAATNRRSLCGGALASRCWCGTHALNEKLGWER